MNLWRRTDPIGGAIGIGDRRLADPVSFHPLPGNRLPPEIQAHGGSFDDVAVEQEFADIGARALRLNARCIDPGEGQPGMILLAMEDVTVGGTRRVADIHTNPSPTKPKDRP